MSNTHCNTGVVHVTHKGTLPGYRIVCLKRDGIANILSISNYTKKYPISYDISTRYKFILKKANEQIIFNQSLFGLYFQNVGPRDMLMVRTTKENRKVYTSCEIALVTESQAGIVMVVNPLLGE